MRALLIVTGLAILGVGAYALTLQRGAIAAPIDSAREDAQTVDVPASAAPTPAEARERAAPATETPEPEPAQEAQAPREPAPPAPGLRPTHVEVRDLVDNALVAGFRWRFTAGAQIVRGEELFGVADLSLPIGVTGVLLVEADGMEPLRQDPVTATAAPQPALQLRLYLRPTRPAAGITMLVRDDVGQPVDHLRVDAFSLGDGALAEGWQLGRPLWSRRASAEDGRYQLPPLPAGAYGVQLRATDADGVVRPLRSWTRSFTLTGDNGFVEDVTLRPGCALRLELVDTTGAPLDPAAHGPLRVTLRSGNERPQPRKWTGLSADGRAVSAIDEAPTRSPIWLADPAAPGGYTLEVRGGDALLASQAIQLGAVAQTVRAVVF